MPRLLILRTGSTAREVLARHGDYDRWFTGAMGGLDARFEVRDLVRGESPVPDGHDGILVTGSTSSAYLEEAWMPPLITLLRRAESLPIPLLGICFGAQMLAQARGGRVVLNPFGWEIGAVPIEITSAGADDPLLAGLPSSFTALATHEDHIESLPPGAVALARNQAAPVQAFRACPRVWGVQFHPELSTEALDELIRLRRPQLEADALAHGKPVDGHVERLRSTLTNPDALQTRCVLRNFVRICAEVSSRA
ncbi:MAG: glutamine amidotransferase-related protein [Candidatus Polarisedimenticolia bacterium]